LQQRERTTPRQRASWLLGGILFLPFLTSGSDLPNLLEQVERRGSITLLTRNGASSYYLGPDGATGPEYELALAFADSLGVRLKAEVADTYNDLQRMLNNHEGELIAANLTRTPAREEVFRFGPDYAKAQTLVVYRRGQSRPREESDLAGLTIAVIAGSSYEERLHELSERVPGLNWNAVESAGIDELLQQVADGEIDATLVDSNIFKLSKPFYPAIRRGFTLPGNQPQAWAFRNGDDDSLVQQSRRFLSQARDDGLLTELQQQFYGDPGVENTVGMYTFLKQVRERLPSLLPVFQEVADAHDLDWRLLAAIGYQESHWDPEAASRTGVRGIMMLTRRTARTLGVSDRLDPGQSIEGGARYFLRMWNRVPERIIEPDRTWMALAAYNMGMGHLEDLRVLTQRQGGNPDIWADVEQRLPLLSQEKHYRTTRYGYARGYEAQRYVRNIRSYYDSLMWMDTHAHPLLVADL
jgi:membrane-bound lytic murein transglycosylase F